MVELAVAAVRDEPEAYIARDRRWSLATRSTMPDRVSGAGLFADISGFTPLTETLANELGSQGDLPDWLPKGDDHNVRIGLDGRDRRGLHGDHQQPPVRHRNRHIQLHSKTDKVTMAGKCVRLDLVLVDGTTHSANFKLK